MNCELCGRPLRDDNTVGVCTKLPCRLENQRRYWHKTGKALASQRPKYKRERRERQLEDEEDDDDDGSEWPKFCLDCGDHFNGDGGRCGRCKG